jgi:hypothetical protein
MPSPEVANLKQHAVLWAASGRGDYGNRTLAAAVEIHVRWESTKTEGGDPRSEAAAKSVTCHTDQSVAVGSELWLGRLSALVGTASPGDVHVVTAVTAVPDVKGKKTKYTLTLDRRGESLSDLA